MSAVAFFNVSLLLVFALRKSKGLLNVYSVDALLVVTALGLIRLLVPIDNPYAQIVRSDEWLPEMLYNIFPSTLKGMFLTDWLLWIWKAGTVGFAIYFFCSELWCKLRNEAFEEACPPEYDPIIRECCGEHVTVKVLPGIYIPVTTGILHRKIYLTDYGYSDWELRCVLRHEMNHVHSRDVALKLLYYVLTACFWWNPVLHVFLRELDTILDLRCDERVCRKASARETKEYQHTLLNLAEQVPEVRRKRRRPMRLHSQLLDDANDVMRQRIERISNLGKISDKVTAMVITVAVVLFVASYFVILQPATFPDENDTDYEIFEITINDAYIEKTSDGRYYFHSANENYDDSEPVLLTPEALEVEPFSSLEIIESDER